MVLYHQMSNQDTRIEAIEADKENQTPSLTGPQPSIYPGPGWQDNFDARRTCYFFVIPAGNKDIIAPFVLYNLDNPFPKLLTTNRCSYTIHSCPLYAQPQTSHISPLLPCNELFFHHDLELTRGVDWALLAEDDPTLAREVQHFHLYKKACDHIAKQMGQMRELLEVERQALYCSSAYLTGANAFGCLQYQIDCSLYYALSFSTMQVKKIYALVCNHVTEAQAHYP